MTERPLSRWGRSRGQYAPLPTVTVVLLVLALIVWGLTRASWTPSGREGKLRLTASAVTEIRRTPMPGTSSSEAPSSGRRPRSSNSASIRSTGKA